MFTRKIKTNLELEYTISYCFCVKIIRLVEKFVKIRDSVFVKMCGERRILETVQDFEHKTK